MISFCTTCKGRLWQLEQTLPHNLQMLEPGNEIVLLDYQSPDGLKAYIFDNFQQELASGKLKYFQMASDYAYTCAYAKNVAHKLAAGDVLFNLDADNTIYEGQQDELKTLTDMQLFVPSMASLGQGVGGRLGYTRALFWRLNGYDERIVGMKGDDTQLHSLARSLKIQPVLARRAVSAIHNTAQQKHLYVNDGEICNYHAPSPPVNYPAEWGKALVFDQAGNEVQT